MKRTVILLLKVLVGIVLVLAVLLGVAAILLNSDSVQNRLMRHATTLLSEKLQTQVDIDHVSVDFFGQRLQLHGLKVEDQRQRDLLLIESIDVSIDLPALRRNEVHINEAHIAGLNAQLVKEHPDSAANFEFIINAFKNDKKEQKTDTLGQESRKLLFDLKKLTLQRISATYNSNTFSLKQLSFRERNHRHEAIIDSLRLQTDNRKPHKRTGKPHRGYFDAGHLDVVASLRIGIHHLGKDSLAATVSECTVCDSASGVNVTNLKFNVEGNSRSARLNSVTIDLPNTSLHFDSALVVLPGKKDGRKLSYSTSEIKGETLIKDISRPFAPLLSKFSIPLQLSVKLSGDDDRMLFRNIKVSTADRQLTIAANGSLSNLHGKRQYLIAFDVSKMQTTGRAVEHIINQFPVKKFMLQQLRALGNISYTGRVGIRWKREDFQGRLNTSAGQLRFRFSLDENNKYLTGNVHTDSLHLGKVIDMPDIGKVACDASFKFDYSKPRTAKMRKLKGGKLPIGQIAAHVIEAKYKMLKFKNIQATIESDGAVAVGQIENRGKRVDLLCSFSFTDTDAMKKMSIKPSVKLHKLSEEDRQAKDERKLQKQKEKAERRAERRAEAEAKKQQKAETKAARKQEKAEAKEARRQQKAEAKAAKKAAKESGKE